MWDSKRDTDIKNRLIFLELSCRSCLYIFEISCFSVASFAIIFSHSEGCLRWMDKKAVVEDGGGIERGDHFLPHKFIKRIFKRWVNSTKQLLNAGRGHQAPRKAAHCLWKEVGKYIKEKKKKKERDKRGRDRAPSWEGSLKKREVSKHQEILSLPSLCWALEAQRAT